MKTSVVFGLLVLGAGHTSSLMAQPAGTFTATGNMTTAHMWHSATLLPNGKVLIAGGWQNVPDAQRCTGQLHVRQYFLECVKLLSSAELYDPLTGTFAPTGNTTTTGLTHTATLLSDGRVLLNWGSSAELYNPSLGTFTALDGLAPGFGTATLLNNGKVLFTGLAAKLYDPTADTLVSTGAYAGTGGVLQTATLLPNGNVLLVGNPGCCADAGRTELYDPVTGTFSLTAPIFAQSLTSITATLLTNGWVLVAAGDFVGGDDSVPISAGICEPLTGTFTATGKMTTARRDGTATLLPDGGVLIAGGDFASGTSAERYDLAAGTFSAVGSMGTPRFSHTATLLPDGRVLIAGGLPYSTVTTSTAELYTPQVLRPAPVLLSLSGDGKGQAAILHANTSQVASSDNPAVVGEALEIYATGLMDGSVIPPQVAIGGRMAEVLWFGNSPGYAGLNQINVRVPGGISSGPAVLVRINYIGRPSNEVTIGVK